MSARDLYAEQRVRARARCQRVVVLSVGLRVDHLHCRQLRNVTAGVEVEAVAEVVYCYRSQAGARTRARTHARTHNQRNVR